LIHYKFVSYTFRLCLAAKKTYVHVPVTAVSVTWSSVKSRLTAIDGDFVHIYTVTALKSIVQEVDDPV